MELTVTVQGTCLVVEVLATSVDHTVSREFKAAVLAHYERTGAREILLDLSRVTFLDSTGIGAIASLRKTALKRGGRLGLFGLCPQVEKIVRVVTLSLFEIHPDRQTAVERMCR